jgi:adenylate kinase
VTRRGLVLLGPPGSGKGTQAAILAERLGIPTISTGALFRDQMGRGTPLGVEAQSYMSKGQLVPDSVTNAMVKDRLSAPDVEAGYILDGYPRNVDQVAVLDSLLVEFGWEPVSALEITLPEDLIVERLLKRAEIEGRADDTAEVIRERLAVYHAQTEPISAVYRDRGALVTVDGLGTVEEVQARILAALGVA